MADADAVRDAGIPVRLTPSPEPDAPAPPPASAPVAGEMSLVGHLTELRNRVVKIVIAIALMSTVGFFFSDQIIAILKAPLPGDKPLYYTGLGDAFTIKLKISIVVGIILAMPVILYQLWAFVAPGLTRRRAPDGPAVDPARPVLLRPRHRDRVLHPAVRRGLPDRVLDRRTCSR